GGYKKWLERKLAAKLLLQPTKQNMALIFTLRSVPRVVRRAAPADSSLTVSLHVSQAQKAVALVVVLRSLPKTISSRTPWQLQKPPLHAEVFYLFYALLDL